MIEPRLLRLSASSLASLPLLDGPAFDDGAQRSARLAESIWGMAGLGCRHNGRIVGYLLLVPPSAAPLELSFDPDAAVLSTLRVSPTRSNRRVARDLVRGVCARLVSAQRRVSAIEAAPSVGYPAVAVSLLAELGFGPTDRAAILRLDLADTVRWLPRWGELRQRISQWVQPAPPVEPARRSPDHHGLGDAPGQQHVPV